MSRTATATTSRKKVMPVGSTRKKIDTQDAESFGQDRPRAMKSTGPALESIEPQRIQIVDGPVNKEKLEEEAFMQDILEIEVHQTTDKTAQPIPQVTVNGRSQYFIRGRRQPVKRMFVECLLRMKKTSFTQQKTQDAEGNEKYDNHPHTVLEYEFAIHHDPAGAKGRDWYNKLRQEV